MKKYISLLAVLCMALFVFATPALACDGPNCGPVTAVGNYSAQIYDHTFAFDKSIWGWGNDVAKAGGTGTVGGEVKTYANSADTYTRFLFWNIEVPAYAFQQGFLAGNIDVTSWANAWDVGLTSGAYAGAKLEGSMLGEGLALGLSGCPEWVDGRLLIGGNIWQYNLAQEVGYPNGQGIFAENFGGINFAAYENFYDSGNGLAVDADIICGEAITKGSSFVTIDPYGNHLSMFGKTENFSKVNTSGDLAYSNVYGNGQVSGMIGDNIGNFAGGTSAFSYDGNGTYGAGDAMLKASITKGYGSTSVVVYGSSSAQISGSSSNGNNVPN